MGLTSLGNFTSSKIKTKTLYKSSSILVNSFGNVTPAKVVMPLISLMKANSSLLEYCCAYFLILIWESSSDSECKDTSPSMFMSSSWSPIISWSYSYSFKSSSSSSSSSSISSSSSTSSTSSTSSSLSLWRLSSYS